MPKASTFPEERAAAFRLKYPWATFHAGQWTKEKPKIPGIYPIASREGEYCGVISVKFHDGILVNARGYAVLWEGWFWSEPLPAPSKAPPPWDGVSELPDAGGTCPES